MTLAISSIEQSPFLTELLTRLVDDDFEIGQVQLTRTADARYEIFHLSDQDKARETLRKVSLAQLRELVNWTASGVFRPLKSAPNLTGGWLWTTGDSEELEVALNLIYPGVIADLFWSTKEPVPVTSYREFVGRQSGMYRIAAMLSDGQVLQVYSACCQSRFCIRRRWWGVHGADPETEAGKSQIPCFEPCALLLELARKSARLVQNTVNIQASSEELDYLVSILEKRASDAGDDRREADFNDMENPRRLALLLEKLKQPVKADISGE